MSSRLILGFCSSEPRNKVTPIRPRISAPPSSSVICSNLGFLSSFIQYKDVPRPSQPRTHSFGFSTSLQQVRLALFKTLLLGFPIFIYVGDPAASTMMDDFQSETDSDYTSYWRDWVSKQPHSTSPELLAMSGGSGRLC